jgi:hypothetical protein
MIRTLITKNNFLLAKFAPSFGLLRFPLPDLGEKIK